jgi:hypothetical protein
MEAESTVPIHSIPQKYYPILPNTGIAATYVKKNAVYTYAQAAQDASDSPGALLEIHGAIICGNDTTKDLEIYVPRTLPQPIGLTEKDKVPPKLFTPLAAAWMIHWTSKSLRRYVFYVNKDNILCDIYEENGRWYEGDLRKFKGGIKCAAYSKLAATRTRNAAQADFICVFYQNCDDSGSIESVCISHMGYNCGPAPLSDPPLVGTALAAVPPVAGIKSTSGTDEQAVVFFQFNTLVLASSQDDKTPEYTPYIVEPKYKSLSGHAYLAAVEDTKDVWCFWTSDDNYIRFLPVNTKPLPLPERVGLDQTAVPTSPIAAILTQDTTRELIILFYLIRETDETHRRRPGYPVIPTGGMRDSPMNIYASTLTRVNTNDKYDWSVGAGIRLGFEMPLLHHHKGH